MDIFDYANNIINDLMKEKNESQTYIAEKVLKIQQSNLSAALNPHNSRHLTIEQYITLADYWDISLDTLFGREKEDQKVSISARSICEWIMYILKTKRACLEPVTLSEKDLTGKINDFGQVTSLNNRYSALVFPNFDTTSEHYKYHLEHREKEGGGIYVNEDRINESINTFIEEFTQIENFKNYNNLPEKAYQAAVNAYLDEVSSKPYISMDEEINERETKLNNEHIAMINAMFSDFEEEEKKE